MVRKLLPALAVAVAIWTPAQANILDTWQEVEANLNEGDVASAEMAIGTLQEEAVELEVRRMTGFAAALVSWAELHPGAEGESMLRAAKQLDPDYPSSYFLASRWSADKGASISAFKQRATGWVKLIDFDPTRRVVGAWTAMWAIFSLAAALVTIIFVLIIRHLRSVAFDARDLGGKIFRPANAWVFALVIVLLPLFAALGPVWLAAYIFILTWPYLSRPLRIWSFVGCLLLAMVGPALAWVQHEILQTEPMMNRVGTMLDERQSDFSTLREFAEVGDELDDIADYHLILGELFRMHGEPSLATLEFQKATLLDPENSRPLVFVANQALENGNAKRAIQHYSHALELDPQNAFAYHNLSLAFDLSRRFQEGDQARARARQIAGREVKENGLRGLDPRIRYPRLDSDYVEVFLETLTPEQLAYVGEGPKPLNLIKQPTSTLSLVFLVGAVVGLVVLFVRLRWFPPANECSKCGKVYRLEAGLGESSVYCSQCVSVFLKRDVVSIEQQTAKMAQIHRREGRARFLRRVVAFVIPGSVAVLDGKVVRGYTTNILAWFFLSGALVWVPTFVPRIEPLAPTHYIQIVFLMLVGLIMVRSGVNSWNRS